MVYSKLFCRLIIVFVFWCISQPGLAKQHQDFPWFPELKPAVAFWIKVFSQFDSKSVIVHDSRDLRIIYTSFKLGEDAKRNKLRIKATIRKIRETLKSIVKKRFYRLSKRERHFLRRIPHPRTLQKLMELQKRIRYQLGVSDHFVTGIRRSSMYFSMIRGVFRNLGVPLELAYLPFVESSFDVRARSHRGASGMWQFTYATAVEFLTVNRAIDERNDPLSSTIAAGKLLKKHYKKFRSWPLSLTAYNHGRAGVLRKIERLGTWDFVNLMQHPDSGFGFASRNFYVSFLAARHVVKNAFHYFPPIPKFKPLKFSVVKLPKRIFVDKLTAHLPELTLSELAFYNPAFRQPVLRGRRPIPKGYKLKIPPPLKKRVSKIWEKPKKRRSSPKIAQPPRISKKQNDTQVQLHHPSSLPESLSALVISEETFEAFGSETQSPLSTLASSSCIQNAQHWPQCVPLETPEHILRRFRFSFLKPLISDTSKIAVFVAMPGESLEQFTKWGSIPQPELEVLNDHLKGKTLWGGEHVRVPKKIAQSLSDARLGGYRRQAYLFFQTHRLQAIYPRLIRKTTTLETIAREAKHLPKWMIPLLNPRLLRLSVLLKGEILFEPVLELTVIEQLVARKQ